MSHKFLVYYYLDMAIQIYIHLGEFGIVYRAVLTKSNREVAVKTSNGKVHSNDISAKHLLHCENDRTRYSLSSL